MSKSHKGYNADYWVHLEVKRGAEGIENDQYIIKHSKLEEEGSDERKPFFDIAHSQS